MPTITKRQFKEYKCLRWDWDNGCVLTLVGLRIIVAAYEKNLRKPTATCWRCLSGTGKKVCSNESKDDFCGR